MEEHTKPRWFRRTWVVATAAGLIGIGIGAASMTPDVTQAPEYQSVAQERDDAEAETDEKAEELTELHAQLAETQAKVAEVEGSIPAREQAVSTTEAQLKKREAAVQATEKKVRQREKAVGIIEREIEANTISDGTYEVGADIKAGMYKTKGTGDTCYWARLTSPGGDIKTNNLGSGPSVVTVSNGDFLELNCGGADWVLQR